VILAGLGWYLFGRGGGTPAAPEPQPQAQAPAPEPQPEPQPAAPAGPTPEEIQEQIARMVTAQSEQLQAGLQAQYDERLKALQRQLDDAQKARAAPAAPPPAPARIETLPEQSGQRVESAAQAVPQNSSQSKPATPLPTAPQPAAQQPAPAAAQQKPAQKPASAAAQPVPAPAPAAQVPDSGGVRQGDLVAPGPGVSPPRVVRAPSPNYPALAKRMKREATVTVRVLVDENGRPSQTEISGKKAGFGLDEAALDYARGCVFEPAKKNGIKVKMWYDLQVAFTLGGG